MKVINQYTFDELSGFFKAIEGGNRYVMLRGGTGTGKTMYAKELAWQLTRFSHKYCGDMSLNYVNNRLKKDSLECVAGENEKYYSLSCGEDSEHIMIIHFHKGSSYENIVYGLSLKTQTGRIVYENELKQFARMCKRAQTKSDEQFVIILDDINRADLSRSLGDVMQALESSGKNRSIPIEGENVPIPDNLYIIATANPTFGSSPDYAWLRRFLVFDITPDEKHITAPEFIRLRNRFEGMNYFNESNYEKYLDYAFCIFKYIKIMYERYFADDDLTIKLQNCPGHGTFMLPYVKNQSFEKYVELFHLKLKHIIVPFLRCALADGLLKNDEDVRFDIDMLDQLGDYCIDTNEKYKNIDPLKNTVAKYYLKDLKSDLKGINERISASSILYLLFLRNPLVLRKAKGAKDGRFLFEPEKWSYSNSTKRKGKTEEECELGLHRSPIKKEIKEGTYGIGILLCHPDSVQNNKSREELAKSTDLNPNTGEARNIHAYSVWIMYLKILIRLYPNSTDIIDTLKNAYGFE